MDTLPWSEFDALFIGGDDEFKLGPDVQPLITEAKRRGLWVHQGRCNSLRRLRIAQVQGCDSADGTFLGYGPDVNLPKVLRWLRATREQPTLDLWRTA